MKKYALTRMRVRRTATTQGYHVRYVEAGAIIEPLAEVDHPINGHWYMIIGGWTYAGGYSDVTDVVERVPIPDELRTPSFSDAQQYLMIKGRTKYNLCGEFCAAFIVGEGINSLLDKWEQFDEATHRIILGRDLPTHVTTVEKMIDAYALSHERYDKVHYDKTMRAAVVSPGRIAAQLRETVLMIGCKISRDGNIQSSGIGHWVVVTDVNRSGIGGQVVFYNSFSNQIENQDYARFMKSVGSSQGFYAPREHALIPKIAPPEDCEYLIEAAYQNGRDDEGADIEEGLNEVMAIFFAER